MTTQEQEIQTIKGRTITLQLSDADVSRIAEKAGLAGLTVEGLLENFVGDLVHGTYSNGSDERMYAERWFDRCGFEMMADHTFLRFLLNQGMFESFLEYHSDNLCDLDELNSIRSQEILDSDDLEEIEAIKDNIAYHQEMLDDMYHEYTSTWKEHTTKTFEDAAQEVLDWADYTANLLGRQSEVATPGPPDSTEDLDMEESCGIEMA